MIPINQTEVSSGKGNCMQSAIASLFEVPLENIPNFIEYKENWISVFFNIFKYYGYGYPTPVDIRDLELENLKEILQYDGGINGHFYAVVKSQTFKNTTHAVIMDLNGNIVHDPNPNKKALKLTYKDVFHIYTTKEFTIKDGKLQV